MKEQAHSLSTLHHLYTLEMIGESYCDDFTYIAPEKPKPKQSLGWNPPKPKAMLITTFPLITQDGIFSPKRSSQMLQDMIFKVLHLKVEECAIFSLYKSQTLCDPQDTQKYAKILLAQILQCPANCGLVFGLEEIASVLFPKHTLTLGASINLKGKKLLITHSLKALIRLDSLKKQTLQDLRNLKALL